MPPLPTYWFATTSDPPLIPESRIVRGQVPVAQIDRAGARERQPSAQVDGAAGDGRDRSLAIDRIADRARTAKALPGRHRERGAEGVGQTQAAVTGEARRRVESGGHDQERVGAHAQRDAAQVLPGAAGQIQDAVGAEQRRRAVPAKIPWFTRLPLTCKVPPRADSCRRCRSTAAVRVRAAVCWSKAARAGKSRRIRWRPTTGRCR